MQHIDGFSELGDIEDSMGHPDSDPNFIHSQSDGIGFQSLGLNPCWTRRN